MPLLAAAAATAIGIVESRSGQAMRLAVVLPAAPAVKAAATASARALGMIAAETSGELGTTAATAPKQTLATGRTRGESVLRAPFPTL
jgi:hypothetical protein